MMIEHNFNLNCDIAISGMEAIQRVKKRVRLAKPMYTLIVMDINMPVVDGVQATQTIREICEQQSLSPFIVAWTALPKE